MTNIATEIRKDKFDLDFAQDKDIPKHMKSFDYWKKCCFKFPLSKIKLLEYLYNPSARGSVPREELYPKLKDIGYSNRRFRDVLKELDREGFILMSNGTIITVSNEKIIYNIGKLLMLWHYVNNTVKPKGAMKDRQLRYYLPSILNDIWKPIPLIIREYSSRYGSVTRDKIIRALKEREGDIYECKLCPKGKLKAPYYRLKR